MEKGTRTQPLNLKHRCNSQAEIDAALAEGFDGVEVDLVWGEGLGVECSAPIILSHEHHGEGPNFFDIDFHGCVVAINVKEYGMADLLDVPTSVDWFVFDVPGPELDLYCAVGHRVFGRFSQWENQCINGQMSGALVDDFTGSFFGQFKLALQASLYGDIALISNELRYGGENHPHVMSRLAKYIIRKTL